ncbi:MAG: ATP-binding protein [Caulobacterales bacterium]|nr:ATP-binding protein [Caulobacterales bacterium]
MAARQRSSDSDQVAQALGLAIIASSVTPLLLLDDDFNVLAASASFCRAFRTDPALAQDRPILALGDGAWNIPQLRSLLSATLSGSADIDAYEMDLESAGATRRLVLHAHRLDIGSGVARRILLTVTDVTESRLDAARRDAALREKDDLLRQRAILLQEVRHRVANSLQIIASVLLQTARRVNSEESRGVLRDAHQRVMSVAALQHQLAASSMEGVPLRAYLDQLCSSIGASMIHDPSQIALSVEADDSIVGPDISISLGLIVTELVINALKHAFPGARHGSIRVGYVADGGGWTLSVTDDGAGMPAKSARTTGLGTSIVEALSRQLEAKVAIRAGHPGVSVRIRHNKEIPAA